MKFIVRRTSHYGDFEKQPCVGAVVVGEDEFGDTLWGIEIGSIEELMGVAEIEKSKLIVGIKDGGGYLEIYDDYRE